MEAFPGFFSELGWLYSVLQFLMVVAWRLVLGENPAFCGVGRGFHAVYLS